MGTSIRALVNPVLLEWARRESGYPVEPIAKRVNVKPAKVLAWERGEAQPTIRQARGLAALYRRPLGVFFLPQPPSTPPLATEYRHLPGVVPGVESPEFRLAVRILLQRREEALELSDELSAPFAEFAVASHLSEGPAAVGAKLRAALGVSPEEQSQWSTEWEGWRRWREAVEGVGVLVFQFPKVALGQVRGVSLFKSPLPVIGINSKESSPAARSFTLLHELVHISLALGKEERAALGEDRDEPSWDKVERFAEAASSAALIPEEVLQARLGEIGGDLEHWDIARMRTLAGRFRVTPLAMATRLWSAGILSWPVYMAWKEAWKSYVEQLPKRKGFATPVDKTLGRCGRPLAQLVLQALDTNRITSVQASRYLDLKFNHFEDLRGRLYKGLIQPSHGYDDGD